MTDSDLRYSTDDQQPRECSALNCGHVAPVQCLLMKIATGGAQHRRVHRGAAVAFAPLAITPWERTEVEVEQRPPEHPGLWEELQTTIARLSRMTTPGAGSRPAESAVPYHAKASAAAAQLGNAVTTWARLIAEENPALELTAITVPTAARWIAHWLNVFPSLVDEHGAEMYANVNRWVRNAERVIDRAPDKVYAGPCYQELEGTDEPCQGQLYASQGKATVWCRECGTRHNVEERQEWLSRTLDDQLVSAAEAAPVLSWLLDKEINRNNIAAWKRDGRVQVHAGRWPYRFGDLLVLARDMKTRKREGSAA